MFDLLFALIGLIVTIALIIAVFRISANTSKTAVLLQEMLALQLMRDDVSESQINGAAQAKLITESQRKFLINRYRERHATTPPPPAAQ